jgi:hypothetical protein
VQTRHRTKKTLEKTERAIILVSNTSWLYE